MKCIQSRKRRIWSVYVLFEFIFPLLFVFISKKSIQHTRKKQGKFIITYGSKTHEGSLSFSMPIYPSALRQHSDSDRLCAN